MVDRIRKVLRQLTKKDLKRLNATIHRIQQNDLYGLDIKKLKGREDIYRLRQGQFRIIFRTVPGAENTIIAVERRSEKTYRDF